MTLAKAQKAVEKAEAHKSRARESLIKALILALGGNPRKVRTIEVTGFRSLFS